MKVVEVRRERLREWINDKYKGIQAGFVEDTGINQGELSGLLKAKSFGERKARNIEKMAGMPDGWLDGPPTVVDYNVTPGPHVYNQVPLISWVQAGQWAEVVGLLQTGEGEHIDTTYRPRRYTYALRVTGDSMEPEFTAGDIIIVEPDAQAENGSFIIVRQNRGEATFKQLIQDGSQILLKPLNDRYKIQEMQEDAVICGVVKEKIKRY